MTAPTVVSYAPPVGVNPRGTLVVLPGRGEDPSVYERFGLRLAADGYPVHVLERDATVDVPVDAVHPVVLVGADTGALEALLAAGRADGLILAGTPAVLGQPSSGVDLLGLDFDAELDARTACPTHRARLADDGAFGRGELFAEVPPKLAEAVGGLDLRHLDTPVLVLHGDADPVAPVVQARALAARLPRAELATVHGGRHDVLNDLSHRTVAAHVVQWLERLRTGAPILEVQSS